MTKQKAEGNTSTGIEDLDRILDGGFAPGFTTLLLCPVGSGSEIFAKQFAASHPEEVVTFFTTAESEEDVRRAVTDAGWPHGALDIVDIQSRFAQQSLMDAQSGRLQTARHHMAPAALVDADDLLKEDSNTDLMYQMPSKEEYGLTDYLGSLLKEYQSHPVPNRIVVNNLDFFFNIYPPEQVLHTLNIMRNLNAKTKGQLLWVLSKDVVDQRIQNRLALMSDHFFEMGVERKGNEFERFLITHNVRNRPEKSAVNTYLVSRDGIVVKNVGRIT
jgi:KaiC/GvpD/RAD55 family RecA-like ATPase